MNRVNSRHGESTADIIVVGRIAVRRTYPHASWELRLFAMVLRCLYDLGLGPNLLGSTTFFLLWPPYVIGGPLYFCPVISIFFLYLLFFLA